MYKTSRGEDVGDFLNMLLSRITPHTSDIHIHTQMDSVKVSYREYGELHSLPDISYTKYEEIKRRLKVYCRIRIDIEEKGQDGSFSVSQAIEQKGTSMFIRVSFLPTVFGQTIVMRLSGHRKSADGLRDLTSEEDVIARLKKGLSANHGLIVVTGPTGSGKTETLYACMKELVRSGRSVVSIEDPVEANIVGIKQVRISEDQGFTFKHALKSVLRQDPDVIVVGETRDQETAELVDLASHTGHLVITTLHVGSIVGVPERLSQLGITKQSLSSSAVMFVGQRLVRSVVDGRDVRTAIFEICNFDKNLRLGLIHSQNSYEFHQVCEEGGVKLLGSNVAIDIPN